MTRVGRKPTDHLGLSDAKKETFLDRNWTASVDTNAANGLPARRVTDHDALKDGPPHREIGPLHALRLFLSSSPTHRARPPRINAEPSQHPPIAFQQLVHRQWQQALVHIVGAIRQHLRQVRCSDGRSLPGAFARALLA
jgi:hypothetical protein